MKIRNVRHKGLRRLFEYDDASAFRPSVGAKLRRALLLLETVEEEEELWLAPGWRAHRLVGDRKGRWSMVVTRNWRLTFRIDPEEGEIVDLDYQDYH